MARGPILEEVRAAVEIQQGVLQDLQTSNRVHCLVLSEEVDPSKSAIAHKATLNHHAIRMFNSFHHTMGIKTIRSGFGQCTRDLVTLRQQKVLSLEYITLLQSFFGPIQYFLEKASLFPFIFLVRSGF
jgi:hypothetical protein